MINIVFRPCRVRVKGASGYCYRKICLKDNPLVKVSGIEELPDDMQLEMFKRIDEENESLFVLGGDGCSLLRKIFIERHLNTEGFIENSVYFTRQKAEYKGFTFNYVINYNL